jgi:hypothetical protein
MDSAHQITLSPSNRKQTRQCSPIKQPERSRTTTWKEFVRSHVDLLAGADFFTMEVLTWRGLVNSSSDW